MFTHPSSVGRARVRSVRPRAIGVGYEATVNETFTLPAGMVSVSPAV